MKLPSKTRREKIATLQRQVVRAHEQLQHAIARLTWEQAKLLRSQWWAHCGHPVKCAEYERRFGVIPAGPDPLFGATGTLLRVTESLAEVDFGGVLGVRTIALASLRPPEWTPYA
jgi:hypothetical protein